MNDRNREAITEHKVIPQLVDLMTKMRETDDNRSACAGYDGSKRKDGSEPSAKASKQEVLSQAATLAASLCTARFVMSLSAQCTSSGVGLECLAQVLPHFDCRVGSFASWDEAQSLLLWRAYDCSVNRVGDAVYQVPGSGKAVQSLGKREKVAWLHAQGHLPLPRHQAYGTVLAKVRRRVDGHNPKTGAAVSTLRSVIERVDGPVLELARTDALFPQDDEL